MVRHPRRGRSTGPNGYAVLTQSQEMQGCPDPASLCCEFCRERVQRAERLLEGRCLMPMYDRHCYRCGATKQDLLEPMATTNPVCRCGGEMERVLMPTNRDNVLGDECDITVKHGLCNPDGTPRRYTSKVEMRREAAKRGLVSHVEHVGGKGTDKSKHTTRWV